MGLPSAKISEFLVNLDRFSKFLKYFKYFEKRSKLNKNLDFFASGECATLSHHFEPSIGYSQIKIDRKLISPYSLQSKIGVHLLNGELTQLLTLGMTLETKKCT